MKLELDNTKDGIRKYWDHDSKVYDSAPGTRGEEENSIWKEHLSAALGTSPKKVLDVGTGTGIIAMFLAELGHDVTGVDFSNGMMDLAKKKALDSCAKITFVEGDVENLGFESGTFDSVTARYVLWTLPNPGKAVKGWARVVRPGGKVVVIDGNWEAKGLLPRISEICFHARRLLKSGFNPFIKNQLTYDYKKEISDGLPHPRGIEKEQIVKYMSEAGLSEINVTEIKAIGELRRKKLPWYLRHYMNPPIHLVSGTVAEGQKQ